MAVETGKVVIQMLNFKLQQNNDVVYDMLHFKEELQIIYLQQKLP